jgi:hypothetical protein
MGSYGVFFQNAESKFTLWPLCKRAGGFKGLANCEASII